MIYEFTSNEDVSLYADRVDMYCNGKALAITSDLRLAMVPGDTRPNDQDKLGLLISLLPLRLNFFRN